MDFHWKVSTPPLDTFKLKTPNPPMKQCFMFESNSRLPILQLYGPTVSHINKNKLMNVSAWSIFISNCVFFISVYPQWYILWRKAGNK